MERTWKSRSMAVMVAGLAAGLTACGSDDADPPVTLTLAADSADVTWNTSASVDVLANDSASRGTLSLATVSAPLHGSATIADGKVSYTPASGYFGPDEITYTVNGADGVSATGTLSLSVSAVIKLSGIVSDGPIANAAVTAAVGTQITSATADAAGAYSLTMRSANPADMVVLTATGVGTQSSVKLESLAGEAAGLALLAAADGTVSAATLPALNVTHVSSAVLALVRDANAAALPVSQAAFDTLMLNLSPNRMVELAAAIKLVVDHGVALPEGVADTLALIDKPSGSTVLASFIAAQKSGSAPTPLDTAIEEVKAAGALSGTPALAVDTPQTLVYFIGERTSSTYASLVTFKPDGTAHIANSQLASAATWTVANGEVKVVLDTPFTSTTYSEENDPVTNLQYTIQSVTTAVRFRQLTGTATLGTALVYVDGTTTASGGQDAGKTLPFELTSGAVAKVQDITAPPAAELALAASELPAGTLLAGVSVDFNMFPVQDILSVTGSGTGKYLRVGTAVTWSVTGGVLKVLDGSSERHYRRLTPALATGEQHWLVSHVADGLPTFVTAQVIVPAKPDLKFVADTSLHRRWQSGISATFFIDIYDGGTGAQYSSDQNQFPPSPTTWTVNAAGELTHDRGNSLQRKWILLRRDAGSIVVMEGLLYSGNPEIWRINIYADSGPAVQ